MKSLKVLLVFTTICLIAGFLCALLVSREPFGYVASMRHGILLLFLIVPITAAFLIAAIIAAIKGYAVYTGAMLLSCFMLPSSFFGSIKLLEIAGFAEYENPEHNEMRPIGSELDHRIVFVFDPRATQEEINKFDETVLRKTVPQPNGILLLFADGVCNFSYPENQSGVTIVDVPFCADATEEQKQRIRSDIVSSPLVRTAFEDVAPGEVRKLK